MAPDDRGALAAAATTTVDRLVDRLAAGRLETRETLTDLSLVAGLLRALNRDAADHLTRAEAELRHARETRLAD